MFMIITSFCMQLSNTIDCKHREWPFLYQPPIPMGMDYEDKHDHLKPIADDVLIARKLFNWIEPCFHIKGWSNRVYQPF